MIDLYYQLIGYTYATITAQQLIVYILIRMCVSYASNNRKYWNSNTVFDVKFATHLPQEYVSSMSAAIMQKHEFTKSIYPLVILLRCIGIQLHLGNNYAPSFNIHSVYSYYAALCMVFTLSVVGFSTIVNFSKVETVVIIHSKNAENVTIVAAANAIVDVLSYAFFIVGSHLAMFFILRKRWHSLVKSFQYCEPFLKPKWFTNLRMMSFYGILGTLLLVKNRVM